MTPHFIIIDDESLNNMICKIVIQNVLPKAFVQTFTDPHAALIYLRSAYSELEASNAIIFLDINMPTLTGWEFLNAFEQFDLNLKLSERVKIYILSSSVSFQDKELAASNKYVLDYIEKPLTTTKVKNILMNVVK